jgi:ATP-binding cassette subfamily B protein
MTPLAPVLWPIEQRAQAHSALAAACRLGSADVEPVECPYPQVTGLLRRGSMLVDLPGGVVALRRATRSTAWVLTPTGRRRRVPLEALRAAVCTAVEAPHGEQVDAVLDSGEVPAGRRRAARAALLRARLADEQVSIGAALVPAVSASTWTLARAARLPGLLTAATAAQVAVYGLFLLSWTVVGGAALAGMVTGGTVLAWAGLSVGLVGARAAATWSAGRLALRAGRLLKVRLLTGVLRLEPEEIRSRGAGQLLGTVLEAEQLETLAFTGGYLGLLAAAELVATAAALLAGARAGLLLAALAGWVLIAVALGQVVLRRRRAWATERLTLTHHLVERLVGHRTRVAFEGTQIHKIDGDRAAVTTYTARSRRLDHAETALVALVPRGFLGTGAALLILPAPALANPTALVISAGGLLLGSQALRKLTLGLTQLGGAAAAGHQVTPLLRAAARPPRTRGGDLPHPDVIPLLQAQDLVYAHPGRPAPVLTGASLTARRGDRLLLTGPSGAGKSTLASLLAGMRLPHSGSLRLGDAERSRVADETWRRHVVLAPQFGDNHVISTSLAFNLLLGRDWPPTPADLAQAEATCRDLGLGELLDAMPAGLAQPVGETGWQLSHGERSRLFAARALLSHAELLVLDESFAALDPETLRHALAHVLDRAPTLLVIAHE